MLWLQNNYQPTTKEQDVNNHSFWYHGFQQWTKHITLGKLWREPAFRYVIQFKTTENHGFLNYICIFKKIYEKQICQKGTRRTELHAPYFEKAHQQSCERSIRLSPEKILY